MKNNRAQSEIVGTLLLVSIVFIMGSLITGFVLTLDFSPSPNATVEITQTGSCSDEVSCNATVKLSQLDNADYIVVTDIDNNGQYPTYTDLPTRSNVQYLGKNPTEVENIPNHAGLSRSVTNMEDGTVLVGPGDTVQITGLSPGDTVQVFAGLDGDEELISEFSIIEK